ncbi:MAG: GGDEF-domain containing protein [Alteromonas sp.]|nr:GGDEF-domain containing protein [Alteromonas sp.]
MHQGKASRNKLASNVAETEIRRRRLIQICFAASSGLFAALFFARNSAFYIMLIGFIALLTISLMALYRYSSTCNYLFLGTVSSILFALCATGAGVFDLAMLGLPVVIIFSAMLGNKRLFLSVLSLVSIQCFVLAWLELGGIVEPNTPVLTWSHVSFIFIIFSVTGFSVYVLVQDIRKLIESLEIENAKTEESKQQIQHLALHDPLTNLPNRVLGERLLVSMLNEHQASPNKLAMLFIDLDNFKPINDALGHAAGDDFLKKISQTIDQNLQKGQCLIRFGGDEFIILAPNMSDKKEVDTLSKQIIRLCSTEYSINDARVVVSASIGIACAPDDGLTFKQLCRKADVAMYEAKRKGRNRFEYYNSKLDEHSDRVFSLLQKLRPAILNNKLEVYYQPLIDLHSDTICSMEALVRWPQEDGGMIFPDQFIPVAESSGLINKLGAFVLEEACRFCAHQHSIGNDKLTVAVNLSFSQFRDNSLPGIVESVLKKTGLAANFLELELTETILADEQGNISTQLEQLKSLGVQFAIDDFGTGYSNLNYLRSFNAGKLKIDKIFITTLGIDEKHEMLVSAIINMAKSLDMKVVAEGVEGDAAKTKLIELGCDIGQGYLWSKPIPESQFNELLKVERQANDLHLTFDENPAT